MRKEPWTSMTAVPSARFLGAPGELQREQLISRAAKIRSIFKRTNAAEPARSSIPFLKELALGVTRDV